MLPKKIVAYLKNKRVLLNWYLKNKPTPPPNLIKQKTVKRYGRKYNLKTLIETGTYKGQMIKAAKKNFKKIYSIELDTTLYQEAKNKFKDEKNIEIIQGDSGNILKQVLKDINEPCLFWLDGHYSGGITTKSEKNTPILKELEAIFNHKIKNHIILIDDARLFIGEDDYPTIKTLESFIQNKKLKITIKNDIIRICLK